MRITLVGLVLGAHLLVAASTSEAYSIRQTEEGLPVRWFADEVVLRLDPSLANLAGDGAAEEAILDALVTWEDSGLLPLTFVVEQGPGGARAGYNANGESHNDVLALSGAEWPYDEAVTAMAITTFESHSGAILDVDIVFNAARPWCTGDSASPDHVDLRDTATHEVGHLLGLSHSDEPTAVMFNEGPEGSTTRRILSPDDLDALIAAYGLPPALGRSAAAGCAVSPAGPDSSTALGAWLLLAAGVLIARRRAR